MKIRTQVTSPIADKAQHGNMEFLLINHPLDCPICDKGGECPLQNQALSHGYAESRFTDEKRTYPKPINISANVLLDRERCVLCARCTRFSEQIAGDPFIALIERGVLQQVGIYEREPFESYFSGNTIQICPVGALTSAAYRFRSRPFDLVSTPSIAEHDACGSAIRVDHRRGVVMRRLAGDDPDVNEEWITDKDRFAHRYGDGDDRLTRPLVRDLRQAQDRLCSGRPPGRRPSTWPSQGLKAAGSAVGVLTGGRLTLEDAYGYAKFARAVLGTNNIDFRARQHSSEEADFLAHVVAGTGHNVSFADLENASSVLLVCLEPEEEAGMIFLRLRKAFRKKGLVSWTLAPYASNGVRKMGTQVIPCAPGDEASLLDELYPATGMTDDQQAEITLDANSVILVGERAAGLSGTFSACHRLAERTGARLAWVPRRAGDRGAVEAGCLPNLLPGGRPVADAAARVDVQTTWGSESLSSLEGRDADEILIGAADAELKALIVAGVDPNDFVDPQAVLEGLEAVGFLISLETRVSAVTERANVVFPVSLMHERSGTFVNWEGRRRPFGVVIEPPNDMPDLRVLAALADALGSDLGFRTPAEARAELDELDIWEGERSEAPDYAAGEPAAPSGTSALLATWRMAIDDSRAVAGEPYLQATARTPEARMSPSTAASAGIGTVAMISNDRGTITLPAVVDPEMVDGVVWLPSRAPGLGIPQHLAASAGDLVTIGPGISTCALSSTKRPFDRRSPELVGGLRGRSGGKPMNLLVAAMDLEVFFNEQWWVVLLKALFAFVVLLVLTLFTIWYERRVVARMQHRMGPNMNGPFGLLQSLADGMKLMFKEDFTPTAADKVVFILAPFVVAIPGVHCLRGDPDGRAGAGTVHRHHHAAAADRPAGVGAVHRGGRLDRRLRHRARRLVVRVDVLAARRAALQRADDLLRGRDGPGAGRGLPVRRLDVHLGDRGQASRAGDGFRHTALVCGATAAVVRDLPDLDGRRDQPGAVRPPRGRGRAGRRLPHRVLLAEVRPVLPGRVHQHGHRLRAGHHAVPRRLARAVAVQPACPAPTAGYWGFLWFVGKVLVFIFIFIWLRGTLPRLRYDQFMGFGWKLADPDLAGLDRHGRDLEDGSARGMVQRPRILDRCRRGVCRAGRPGVLRRPGGAGRG